jgi:hypothetical protein
VFISINARKPQPIRQCYSSTASKEEEEEEEEEGEEGQNKKTESF